MVSGFEHFHFVFELWPYLLILHLKPCLCSALRIMIDHTPGPCSFEGDNAHCMWAGGQSFILTSCLRARKSTEVQYKLCPRAKWTGKICHAAEETHGSVALCLDKVVKRNWNSAGYISVWFPLFLKGGKYCSCLCELSMLIDGKQPWTRHLQKLLIRAIVSPFWNPAKSEWSLKCFQATSPSNPILY